MKAALETLLNRARRPVDVEPRERPLVDAEAVAERFMTEVRKEWQDTSPQVTDAWQASGE